MDVFRVEANRTPRALALQTHRILSDETVLKWLRNASLLRNGKKGLARGDNFVGHGVCTPRRREPMTNANTTKRGGRTCAVSFAESMYAESSHARSTATESMDVPRSTSSSLHEQLSALASVGQELVAGGTLAEGFQRAMRLLDQRLGAKRAALLLAEGEQRPLTVDATYGIEQGGLRPRHGAGVAGRVAQSALPIVVPSVAREPMALSELAEPSAWREAGFCLVSVPVSVGRRCVGALSVYFSVDAGSSPRAHLGVVQLLASFIAQSLRPPSSRQLPASETTESSGRGAFEYANMIGASQAMRQVYEEIGQVARTTATVLVLGESGTGKELIAQAIHANSDRADRPFIKINTAAFPDALFESELFGYERGAFTGAVGRKKGRLDRAQGGTLFLDEIGDLPMATQAKLLRVLQSRDYERLGGTETLRADVRLIAATNKDLTTAVTAGTFREDLYYRLNVFTITAPPLRDRRGDVPALAQYFLERFARDHRRSVRRISSGALERLTSYEWPGNVRELENAIERAIVSCSGTVIEESHLPERMRGSREEHFPARLTLAEAVAQVERRMIEEALLASRGNLAKASRVLGTTERILRYKVGKYGLSHPRKT
jgi:Nif-specific regulatory protein